MIKIVWERWKKLKINQTTIKVSSLGRVKEHGKILEPFINSSNGYFVVRIGFHLRAVHRLVALAFLKKDLTILDTIDHKDSNRRNNAVSNLEVVTAEENQRRATEKLIIQPISADELLGNTFKMRIVAYNMQFKTMRSAVNYILSHFNLPIVEANRIEYAILYAIQNRVEYANTTWSVEVFKK